MPRCVTLSSENFFAIVFQMSQSLRDCHGVVIAGLNEWMNGCISVVDRSYFSYQVAAGRMTSECNVWLVIRKSRVTTRSIVPSGASDRRLASCVRDAVGGPP